MCRKNKDGGYLPPWLPGSSRVWWEHVMEQESESLEGAICSMLKVSSQ